MCSRVPTRRRKQFKKTPIGEIPEDWEVVKLRDVLLILRNGLTARQNKEGVGYPVTRIETIAMERIDPSKVGFVEDVSPEDLDKYRLHPGDILFSHINSLAHIGKTAIYEEKPELLLHGMNLLLLRPDNKKIESWYLLWLLKFYRERGIFKNLAKKAVNQASLNQTELGKLKIPLPPLPEQKKIAEILRTVDEAIEKTNLAIEKTERLKKGLMRRLLTKGIKHERFKKTKIGEIPEEWKVTTIGKECIVGTGGTPSRNNSEYFGGRIPWVKSTEVDYNIIEHMEETLTELGLKNSNAKIYPAGTLIIAMYGQGATRGKCAILGIDAAINQACAAVVPKDKNRVHIPYLYYWCQFRYNHIRRLGQGANQSNLNLSLIRSIKFPLPPLSEQKQIAEILMTVDKKLELLRKRREKLERIKKGLMKDLLTGRRRVKV